jgi:hypothetical protein
MAGYIAIAVELKIVLSKVIVVCLKHIKRKGRKNYILLYNMREKGGNIKEMEHTMLLILAACLYIFLCVA